MSGLFLNSSGYEIVFEANDELPESSAADLIDILKSVGDHAEVAERRVKRDPFAGQEPVVLLIPVVTSSLAGLAAVAAFLQRQFRRGVMIDVRADQPRISKESALPRGSLLVLWRDGRQELRDGLSDSEMGALLRNVLNVRASDAGDEKSTLPEAGSSP